jgi:hypothetical protein
VGQLADSTQRDRDLLRYHLGVRTVEPATGSSKGRARA